MQQPDVNIIFTTCEQTLWLNDIVHYREQIESKDVLSIVQITLDSNITYAAFEPYHIVTLSCLIDVAKKKGALIQLIVEDEHLKSFIWNDVRIREYWNGTQIPHYSSAESKNFNLWRIENKYIQSYAISLFNYFQRVHFKGLDLGGLANGLVELHQNVVDHACANGTAFSYITYNEDIEKICIAVCDFGVGIPYTLRGICTDEQKALKLSLKDGISAKTNSHNFGMGLSDVESLVTDTDTLRMISSTAMLVEENGICNTFNLNFNFRGTLVYLTIDKNSFYTDEIIGDLEL